MFISKSKLWGILGDDALAFADFLNSTDVDAAKIKVMLETCEGVTVDGSLVQNTLIPLLQSKGIISQSTVDRFNSYAQPLACYYIAFTDATEKQAILDNMSAECSGEYSYSELPTGFHIWVKGVYSRTGAEKVS